MNAITRIRTDLFRVSQAEFAAICDVSQATVSRWESEKFPPGLKEMQLIRASAISRNLAWNDALFFMPTEQDGGGERATGAAA